jgi:small subunit ribosomal protein S6
MQLWKQSFHRKENMQRNYELMVLLHPDLEIDVETPINKLEGLVGASGGRVTKRDNWGKKRLAYRIAHQDFAVYVYFELQLDPSKVRELENALLITEEVLRHILVSHEEGKPRTDKASGDRAAKGDKHAPADDKPEADDAETKSDDKKAVTNKEGAE